MNKSEDLADGFFRRRNIENLLLMTVLGDGMVREKAKAELRRRRVIRDRDDYEGTFMTNLSVV